MLSVNLTHQNIISLKLKFIGYFLLVVGLLVYPLENALYGLELKLTKVAEGFHQPTEIAFLPNSNTDMIVLEKSGLVWLVDLRTGRKKIIIDITSFIVTKSEQGLLGIAFSNRYSIDKKFYLSYVTTQEDADGTRDISVVSEYSEDLIRIRNPIRTEGVMIFSQVQPYSNHNGGCIRMFPDDFLYLGLGDGGLANDPLNAGQDLHTNLGKLVRFNSLDITPVVEIFASGLRNPWKFSRDSDTGEIYLADVGQDRWEEVNIIYKDGNYGWNVWEGNECFRNNSICSTQEGRRMARPIHTYGRDSGFSIIGGYVYRGTKIPQIYGRYVYGDFGSGKVWMLWKKGNNWLNEKILDTKMRISTFGQSSNSELYIAGFSDGKIYHITK